MSLYDPPIIATGGDTVQDINGNRIHTFTTVGTSSFVVTRGGPVEVLVVAGGGSGGMRHAGGGGAGGLIYNRRFIVSPSSITVTVGDGGASVPTGSAAGPGFSGANSVFGSLTAIGGGYGNGGAGGNGGSGGGTWNLNPVGTGTAGQGNNGAFGSVGPFTGENAYGGGGGGGAGAAGTASTSVAPVQAGAGGIGLQISISGTATYYAGGGGGGTTTAVGGGAGGAGGLGGGGAGGGSNSTVGIAGTNGTGGGGGGGGFTGGTNYASGKGGSGIVIVRYPLGTVLTLRDGLSWGYYTGYFADDVNFFTGAPSVSGIVTSIPSINAGTNGYVPANQSWSNYSVQWTGWFLSNYTGTWTFYTNSDDASYLWIGPNATSGFTVANSTVNNAGLHGMVERSGTASLVAGQYYPIRIQFGENGGGDNMIVSFSNPGLAKTTNGQGFFYPALTPGIAGPWGIFTATPNGLTSDQAATSGLALRQGYPNYTSGTYWLKPTSGSVAGLAFVDMTTDGGGWTMVYETVTATRVGNSIVYSINNSSNLSALSFTRVAYSMNNFNSWAFTSFDSWSSTITNHRIPSPNDVFVNQRRVTNLNVVSSNTNVTTGTGLGGALEIWNYDYSTGRNISIGAYGSDGSYDINDTHNGGGSYGSFQVHDITNLRPVICWNNHSASSPDIGFGPQAINHPDWTFTNRGATSDFRVRVFVR